MLSSDVFPTCHVRPDFPQIAIVWRTKLRTVRLAGGWWLICSERKVPLADCRWLVCCERKVLLSGG
jgi:hypothetical protein